MPTAVEHPSSDSVPLEQDAIFEHASIIKERNELQLKACLRYIEIDWINHTSNIWLFNIQNLTGSTHEIVNRFIDRPIRVNWTANQIKQVVDVPESSINADDPTGWQEDKYHKIRKHLQQLISQAERTLVSNGLEDTEEVLVDDDHTAVNHKIKLNQNESESISRQFTELMKAVDENGEYVCARCHAKPKKEDNKNHLQLVAAKLGIPEDFIITLLRMAPYLARHAFSAFTVLTAILPALRSILGRRKAKLLPKMKVVSVNRTKKAILSEVVYFTILVITYTREIFGEDGAFSAIILRGKELWQAVTNRDTTDINADSDDTERRQRMLCNFGNLVNKLYAFIETNERNEKNVKKVVSNTVKVESIVGKLTKTSSARSSPLMSLTTLIIYAAGIVGAWQVSKRSSLS